MQYKYFTEKLYTQGGLDLTKVFPDRDLMVRQQSNVDYGFPEIVEYLKVKSKNFSVSDKTLMDFDYAIKEIISRYYKSIGEDNPFYADEDKKELDKYQKGLKPRDPVTTENGKIKAIEGKSTKSSEPTTGVKKTLTKEDLIKKVDTYLDFYKLKKNDKILKKAQYYKDFLELRFKYKYKAKK
jgi:hypothetical protein